MRKIRTRAFSILLTCAMLLSLLPVTALASEDTATVTTRDALEVALDNPDVTTINIANDIDMGTDPWSPAVIERPLEIDGHGYTIFNMKVNTGVLKPSGSGVAGDGGSCDYYAGFIGNNKSTLTINNLSFSNAEVDIDPLTVNLNSTGSSILAVVCANNSGGTLTYNNVSVDSCVVRGYTKVGILHGFSQDNGVFTANKCSVTNCDVVLEADGSDKEACFSGILVGYDGNNSAKTNGVKISNSNCIIDSSVNWGENEIRVAENGVKYVTAYGYDWGLTCDTYSHGSYGTNAVKFVAEVDDYQYEALADALAAAEDNGVITLLENTDCATATDLKMVKSVTVDFNEKTFTSNNGNIAIRANATGGCALTLKDGTITAANGTYCTLGAAADSKITAENMTLNNSTQHGNSVKAFSGGTIELRNTILNSINGGGGVEAAGGTVNIYDCTIQQTDYYDWNSQIAAASGGKGLVNIYGGEFTTGNYGLYIFSSGGTINVYDGTFTATGEKPILKADLDVSTYPNATAVINIFGGIFQGNIDVDNNEKVQLNITGGSFSADPRAYLATGYTAVKDEENNLWVVKAADGMVAEVGTPDSNGTVSAEVGGNFSGDEEGNGVVTDENGTVTITATTATPEPTVSKTEVTINNAALTSVETSDTVSNVAIVTNVGTVTLDKAAWDAVTANADGDSVVLSVEENNKSITGWTVTAATPDGDTVFSTEDNPDGTITISVPYTASGESSSTQTIYYINENGDLEAFTAEYTAGSNGTPGRLTWETRHLSFFVIPGPDDEAIWMINGVPAGSGSLVEAIEATATSGGTISLLKNITADNTSLTDTTSAVYVIPNGVNFNGNNHKITAAEEWKGDTGTNNHILAVQSDGTTAAQTTIQNVTIIGDPNSKSGIHAYNGANVVLKNVNIQNCGSVGVQINGATVNATDLNISGSGWGSINVDQGYGVSVKPTLTFNSGTLSDTAQIYTELKSADEVSITVSEASGLKQVHSGNSVNLKGYDYYTDDVSKLGVAYNENTNTIYETLEEALTEATSSGNTITVVKSTSLTTDATVGSGVTLVVNPGVTLEISEGKTLTNNGTIKNNGIIDGNVTSGSGAVIKSTVTFSVIPSNATIVVTKNGSTVTGNNGVYLLENGTYSYTVSASGYYTQSGTFTVSRNAQAIAVNLRAIPTDSGGGSGSATGDYLVNVDRTTGGRVTVNPGRADRGDTVTITIKPDEGYELGKLTVTDKDGDKITLTQKDDNKYTFKMPAGKVTVKATFTEIEVEPEQPELPFSDVAEQDWFYDAVVYVYENELMNGTSATTFSPSVTTSRAMMLTMLARYDGVDTSTGSTWYEAGAAWAVAEGVSDGTNLEADLTREQLVTMLWRYAGSPMVEKDLPDYPDRDEVSDWAVRAMVWAVDNGIITGNGAGELNPQGSASRAEVATILMRFIQL